MHALFNELADQLMRRVNINQHGVVQSIPDGRDSMTPVYIQDLVQILQVVDQRLTDLEKQHQEKAE